MKWLLLTLLITVCPLALFAQTSTQKGQLPPHPNLPASQEVQTEKIVVPGQKPTGLAGQAAGGGFLEPAQVKALMHKLWLEDYRLGDLLAQVHPEKWNMPAPARQSFEQGLDSLHRALTAEEEWRGQFDARPGNLYLGFETYVAIGALLPRVDSVAHSVSQYENASFGAQYSQTANRLYDLQQVLEPHLEYLLKNQDGILLAMQTNLASCQNELNFAEHNKEGRAVPMKNIAPVFKGRRRTAHTTQPPAAASKTAPKGTMSSKPGTKPSNVNQKK